MKNEHWRGLASDGCNQLSRFHSRFHLRFQFELRGSAQSDPRRLKGPTNLRLFFKSIGKFLITVSNNSWKSKFSIFFSFDESSHGQNGPSLKLSDFKFMKEAEICPTYLKYLHRTDESGLGHRSMYLCIWPTHLKYLHRTQDRRKWSGPFHNWIFAGGSLAKFLPLV